jgi:hypothetical protein
MKGRSDGGARALAIGLTALAVATMLALAPTSPASAIPKHARIPLRLLQLYPLHEPAASAARPEPAVSRAHRGRHPPEAVAGYSPIWLLLPIACACLVAGVLIARRLGALPVATSRRPREDRNRLAGGGSQLSRHGSSQPKTRKHTVFQHRLHRKKREPGPRPRREVRPVVILALWPLFCYCFSRRAWILRGVGERYGPVLRCDREEGSDRASAPSRFRRRRGGLR